MERGRDRDRDRGEEHGLDHDQEMRQDGGGGGKSTKGPVLELGEFVTSPLVYRPRQRSPLSPLSQREMDLSPMAFGTTAEKGMMMAESGVPPPAASGSSTTRPETTMLSVSASPPAAAAASAASTGLSTSLHRGPMLTNQDDVDEKLKRMNETFMRSLEGIGKGGGGVRRRDKEKGKEKEVESLRDTGTKRGLFLVSPSEGEGPTNASGGESLVHTSASRYPEGGQQQPTATSHTLGRGRSTSTSTSASSEAVGGASQGSEEVIGRMDFFYGGGESG